MAEKSGSSEVCRNGATDEQKKKAAAAFLMKKLSGGHLPQTTAQPPPLPSVSYSPIDKPLPPSNGSIPSITKSENAANRGSIDPTHPPPLPSVSYQPKRKSSPGNGSIPSFTRSEIAANPGPVRYSPPPPPLPSVYYPPKPPPPSSRSLSSLTKSENTARSVRVVSPQPPPFPSVHYPPPKPPPHSNGSPPSFTRSENAARPGSAPVTVTTRVTPPPRPSPPHVPTTKLKSDASWRTELTQSEHHSRRREHEMDQEAGLTRSERPPPRPAPLHSKPGTQGNVVAGKAKSESPPAQPIDTQPPPQQNRTGLTHSNASAPTLAEGVTQPIANGSSKGYTKSVRIAETPDGDFHNISPLRRRRSRSLTSADSTRRFKERSTSLTRSAVSSHSTRDAAKSPGKRRLFSLFQRSSPDHQECSKASGKPSKLTTSKAAVKTVGEDSSSSASEDFREKRLRRVPTLQSGIHLSESPRPERHRHSDEYPQLFEYLLIIEAEKKASSGKLEPKITYRFPREDDHFLAKQDEVVAAIPRFCFPDIEHLRNVKKSERYSFVLTDIKGNRKFGYCRRIRSTQKHALSPEVFCIVSPLGCFQLYERILDEIEERRKFSRHAVYTFLQALIANPFPAPGKSVSVKVFSPKSKGRLEQETLTFTRPVDSRLEHVDFGELFSFTSVKKVLYIVASLMFERRVILTSKKLSSLTSCCHSLLALLYPITWQHVYIPILPDDLIDMVSSPTPYLVGISPQAAKCLDAQESGDVLLVDLDTSKRLRKIGDEKTLLPPRVMSYLVESLEALLAQNPESKRVGSTDFNTQVADIFIRVQVYFLGRTTQYLREDGGEYTLDREELLAGFYDDEERQFAETVLTTQMFDMYLEEVEKALRDGVVLNGHFEQKLKEWTDVPLEPNQFFHRRKKSYFGKK